MRPSIYRFLFFLLLSSSATASWWTSNHGGKNDVESYSSWSPAQLRAWLEAHRINIPSSATLSQSDLQALVAENWDAASTWTYGQYQSAQQVFADVRDDMFDRWDESQLRQFLLRQGVVAPKGPKEYLVLLAKARYNSYRNAASTLVHEDTAYQMSSSASSAAASASSAVAQATKDAFRVLEDNRDYVYSTWSDSQLGSYLEKKGVLKAKEPKTRDQLLAMMRDVYATVTQPIYDAWSDSTMHEWLLTHGIIKSDFEKNRDKLRALMNRYYYSVNDAVWSTWSDSQLKLWLVDRGYIKSDAEVNRDKMMKIVADNYLAARDTFWNAWSDSSLHEWLIEHGYLRTDAQVKRDELIKLANEKFNDYSAKTAAYLTWPDARLRAYLRERGVHDESLPPHRLGLLQETRIRWVQAQNRAEAAYNGIKDIVNEGVFKAEEGLSRVWSVLTGHWEESRERATRGYEKATEAGWEGYEKGSSAGQEGFEKASKASGEAYEKAKQAGQQGYAAYESATDTAKAQYEDAGKRAANAKEWSERKASEAQDRASSVRESVGETVKQAGQKLKGEL